MANTARSMKLYRRDSSSRFGRRATDEPAEPRADRDIGVSGHERSHEREQRAEIRREVDVHVRDDVRVARATPSATPARALLVEMQGPTFVRSREVGCAAQVSSVGALSTIVIRTRTGTGRPGRRAASARCARASAPRCRREPPRRRPAPRREAARIRYGVVGHGGRRRRTCGQPRPSTWVGRRSQVRRRKEAGEAPPAPSPLPTATATVTAMTSKSRKWWWIGGGILVAAFLVAVVAPYVYIHFIEPDPAPKLVVEDAPTVTTVPNAQRAPLAGTWNITTGSKGPNAASAAARMIGDATAWDDDGAGAPQARTTEATMTIASRRSILTTVKSGRSQRDGQFQGRIMNTAVPERDVRAHRADRARHRTGRRRRDQGQRHGQPHVARHDQVGHDADHGQADGRHDRRVGRDPDHVLRLRHRRPERRPRDRR